MSIKRLVTAALAMVLAVAMMMFSGCGAAQSGNTTKNNNVDKQSEQKQGEPKQSDFPKKGITLIVPWKPGGSTDIMARYLQPIFKSEFGVDLVVKNVDGGGSAVGLTELISSKPDGYTVALASSSFLALVAQERMKVSLDDTVNISTISEDPLVLVVKNGGKYDSTESFIDAAKKNPKKVSIGIPGTNNVNQAFAELLGRGADAQFLFMPFDGGSRAITEIMGGHVDAAVLKPSEVIAQVNAGEVKALGVFSREKLEILPETPTFEEVGYNVFTLGEITQVGYIVAPKGISDDVRNKLSDMFAQAISTDEFQELAKTGAFVSKAKTGEELDTYISNIYEGLKKVSSEIFTK